MRGGRLNKKHRRIPGARRVAADVVGIRVRKKVPGHLAIAGLPGRIAWQDLFPMAAQVTPNRCKKLQDAEELVKKGQKCVTAVTIR
jgi:hypothetical protein